MEERKPRPYKVCDFRRVKTKGIVAGSLEELKEKACSKLGVTTANCRVFIEGDGTEIDEEDYFSFLEEQTKLMIVGDGEEWSAGTENVGHSQLSTGSFGRSLEINESLEFDGTDAGDMGNILPDLLIRIKNDPAFFVSLSDERLQEVLEVESDALAAALDRSVTEAKHSQDACQQELDRRTQLREATQLLKLYDRARQCAGKELANKRQRTET